MDSAKVQAIHEWKVPRSAREVRGFHGLAGYYRKFIHNYDSSAKVTASLRVRKAEAASGPHAKPSLSSVVSGAAMEP